MFFRGLKTRSARALTLSQFNRHMSSKLEVLRLGPTRFAQQAWDDLTKEYGARVVETSATSRPEFVKELEAGKWKEVNYITRTFESVTQTGRIDEEMIELLKKYTQVKAISHNGAGYDQVDAEAAGKAGIQLSNVPSLVDAATADTHVYLLIGALRNFEYSSIALREGKWPGNKCAGTAIGHDPEDKVLGIIGMGGIGRAIRDRMAPFGLKKVLYYNRHQLSPELQGDAEYTDLDTLLKESDIISISVPLNAHTKYLINKDTIAKMKDGVTIVNTARGPVIKEADLKEALKSGKVGSFGTDVFENEPNADLELVKLPNVIALPHMGTHTVETMKKMEEFVVKNVEEYAKTGKVLTIVPEQKTMEF